MASRLKHKWEDNFCTGCGIEKEIISVGLNYYTLYYKGTVQLKKLPECSGHIVYKPKQTIK